MQFAEPEKIPGAVVGVDGRVYGNASKPFKHCPEHLLDYYLIWVGTRTLSKCSKLHASAGPALPVPRYLDRPRWSACPAPTNQDSLPRVYKKCSNM